jgi:tetratricopeptide (TPR) repeat protein
MTLQQQDDRARIRRQKSELAVRLATESRWDEAATVNRELTQLFPSDVEAYNRLGKALTELGSYADARDAYRRSIELDSTNAIARKNLLRLEAMGDGVPARPSTTGPLSTDLFIEETGKSVHTVLQAPNGQRLSKMSAGDLVSLAVRDNAVLVENAGGEYIGTLEPRLAIRLRRLIGRNYEYAAALTSLGDGSGRIIIKETHRPPEETAPSFPSTITDGFRPYVKEGLLRYDGDEDDDGGREEADDDDNDWDGDAEPAEPTEVRLFDFQRTVEEPEEEFEE